MDANQASIVSRLREIPGLTVVTGYDDIIVGWRGRSYWYEIKRHHRRHQLKDSQKKLLDSFTGHYKVVCSAEEILCDIGILK